MANFEGTFLVLVGFLGGLWQREGYDESPVNVDEDCLKRSRFCEKTSRSKVWEIGMWNVDRVSVIIDRRSRFQMKVTVIINHTITIHLGLSNLTRWSLDKST